MTDEPFRAFVSLDVAGESVARIAALAKQLRASTGAPRASWSPLDAMHVTVKFFAQLDAASATALGDSIASIAERRIDAVAGEVSAFPSPSRARVLVVPLGDPDGRIAAIAEAVVAKSEALGYAREARPFKAHVTLARCKAPFNAKRWLATLALEPLGAVALDQLVLYKSVLGSSGAVHTPLARATLA